MTGTTNFTRFIIRASTGGSSWFKDVDRHVLNLLSPSVVADVFDGDGNANFTHESRRRFYSVAATAVTHIAGFSSKFEHFNVFCAVDAGKEENSNAASIIHNAPNLSHSFLMYRLFPRRKHHSVGGRPAGCG